MSAHQMFHYLADAWARDGRPAERLIDNEWRLLALICWSQTDGAKKDGVSDNLAEFTGASRQAMTARFPNWWDGLLAKKDYCEGCGERYSVGNMSVCTEFLCLKIFCFRCVPEWSTKAANGNRQHTCGGELVG